MSITAIEGPTGTFGTAVQPPNASNPEVGPCFWYMGDGLLDPRAPYTYQPGQRGSQPTYTWYSTTALPLINQAPSTASTTNIVNAQTPTAGTALTLVSSSGSGITVATQITSAATNQAVTGLLGIDVFSATNPMNAVVFGAGGSGTGGPMRCWNPQYMISRCLVITTNADDTGGTYTVAGYDIYGYPMTQTVTGVNNSTVATTKAFKYVASVTPAGTINSTSVSVGTTDTIGLPLRTDQFSELIAWWGTPQAMLNGGGISDQTVVPFPLTLSTIANSQVYEVIAPFDGAVISLSYAASVATTTGSKGATLTLQANGSNVTGGVLALASNTDTSPIGHTKTSTAVTAANTFTAGQTVGFIASSVTAFTEGSGIFSMVLQNNDEGGGTFTAAVTTSPATATTGDVRGTFALPSASDGTKKLTVFWTPIVANMTTTAGLVGVTQV